MTMRNTFPIFGCSVRITIKTCPTWSVSQERKSNGSSKVIA